MKNKKCRIREEKMNTVVFEDDIMVWGHKEEELHEHLNTWEEVVKEYI